jgi:hypothetical protein
VKVQCFYQLARERKYYNLENSAHLDGTVTRSDGTVTRLDGTVTHTWMEQSRDRKLCASSTNMCEERVTRSVKKCQQAIKGHRGRSSNAVNNHAGALQRRLLQPGPVALQ